MSHDLSDVFQLMPTTHRGIKRTYSHRHQVVQPCMDHGLPTPPASSSPPASPILRPIAVSATNSMPPRLMRGDARARSITGKGKITTTTAATATVARRGSEPRRKELVQMHLNLAPAHVTCKECGMSYTRTISADVAMHKSFHGAHLLGQPCALADGTHRLAMTRPTERALMAKCCALVDAELSASLTPITQDFSGFLLVRASRIQSFLLVQPITRAQRLLPDGALSATHHTAALGVNRMWTARQARGSGCIRALLDHAMRHFMHGCLLGPRDVAFTQLSESGLRAVTKWQPDADVLIYSD